MKRYYRFTIPRHDNGDIAIYPKEWAGVFANCPAGMTGIFYNDRDAFGIGTFDQDDYKPNKKEMTIISESEALAIMSKATQGDPLVFNGKAQVQARWDEREAAIVAENLKQSQAMYDKVIADAVEVLNG